MSEIKDKEFKLEDLIKNQQPLTNRSEENVLLKTERAELKKTNLLEPPSISPQINNSTHDEIALNEKDNLKDDEKIEKYVTDLKIKGKMSAPLFFQRNSKSFKLKKF